MKKKIAKKKLPKENQEKVKQPPQKEKVETPQLKEKKDPYIPTTTDQKIKALLDFEHIEELFYTLSILDDKEVKKFVEHYKKSDLSASKDKKIDLAIRNSNNAVELTNNIRDELVHSLEDEIQEIKSRLSTLSKKGKDSYVEKMKLLTAPLKIKVFKATGKKEDFYKIKKIISEVDEQIKPKEEQLQKEIVEKEARQKEKEEMEKKAKELKEKIKKGEDIREKTPQEQQVSKQVEQ